MFGAVCFHSGLNLEQRQRLELQQKQSLAIIFGTEYGHYKHARSLTNLERLQEGACLKCAKKTQANPKHSYWFFKKYSVMTL